MIFGDMRLDDAITCLPDSHEMIRRSKVGVWNVMFRECDVRAKSLLRS